jgi:hypothetical protein
MWRGGLGLSVEAPIMVAMDNATAEIRRTLISIQQSLTRFRDRCL